jgi:hypothetical protein
VREKVRGIPETVLVRSKEKETRETKNPWEEEELDCPQSATQQSWLNKCLEHGKSRNKSFLFGGSTGNNNPRTSQQLAFGTDSTLGKFGMYKRSRNGGMAFDLQFYFVDASRVREGSMPICRVHSTSDHENTATSSRMHTKQVTPSWLGFEAFNPLESLLLH